MGNRYLKSKVIKNLYAKSGNICAFPGCSCKLFFDETNLSEICHIQGLNPTSARYNPNLSDDEANSIENMILLCPTHHKLVDQQPLVYSVERLKEMKTLHEKWVEQQLYNEQKDFYTELQKIFQKFQFDRILLEGDFCAPFPESYLDAVEEGYLKIRDLLNIECARNIPSPIKVELYSFTRLLEYTITVVSMKCSPNKSGGYAIPHYYKQDEEAIRANIKQIQKIYVKYRFT